MTPEQEADKQSKDEAKRASGRVRSKKHYHKKQAAMTDNEKAEAKMRRAEYLRKDYALHPDKYKNRTEKWCESHPEEYRKIRRAGAKRTNQKAVENLKDNYVAKLIGLPVEMLRNHPDGPEILEAKREQLAALRKLSPKKPRTKKHAQESTNNEGNP